MRKNEVDHPERNRRKSGAGQTNHCLGRGKTADEVKELIDNGIMVSDEKTNEIILKRLNEDDCKQGFVLDGYPRNVAQALSLDEILDRKKTGIDTVVYIDIDEETIMDRLSKRRVCKECGANYHIENMPPKVKNMCDSCSCELMQREDDQPEVIKKRW